MFMLFICIIFDLKEERNLVPVKITVSSCFSSNVLLFDVFVDFVKLMLLSTSCGSFKEKARTSKNIIGTIFELYF